MRAANPRVLAALEDFKREFGSDEGLVVALSHPRLLSFEGLSLLADLSAAVAHLDGVTRIIDLTTVNQVISGQAGAESVPLLGTPIDDAAVVALKDALERNPHYTNLLISADRSTAGIFVEIEDRRGDDDYRAALIASIRRLASDAAWPAEVRLSGLTAQKHEVATLIQADQAIFVPLAVVVIAVVLWGFARRPAAVVLPLLVTATSLVWTLGLYALAGLSLNTITSLLSPVVMVLSVATSVHVYYGWLEGEIGSGRTDRIIASVKNLATPCLFTALTTAFGLGALALSEIPAVREFGVFAASGVMISFVVGITLVPVGLTWVEPPPGSVWGRGRRLTTMLARSAELSIRHPYAVMMTAVIITAVGVVGMVSIRSNTDLTRFFKADNWLRRDTTFIDENLTGVNSLEFLITRRDGKQLTSVEDVRRIDAMSRWLGAQADVVTVLSIADVIAEIYRGETGGKVASLPTDAADLFYCFDLLEASGTELTTTLVSPDFRIARISARIRAIGSLAGGALITAAESAARDRLGDQYKLVTTGAFHEVVVDSNRLVASQVRTFGLAFVLVMAAMAALLRRPILVLVSLIPNVIPVVASAGAMGWLGIDLSTGTVMVAAVVIGMAVDDTIHYLVRFGREYDGDTAAAIRRVTTRTGMALTVTSTVLVLGLWVGGFGSFKPTTYFSLLSGTTMILALACDLLVLPACLVIVSRAVGERPL